MSDVFIPASILSRVVVIENDSSKYKGYKANIIENNWQNHLHHAIRSRNINESSQNPYLNLIYAIHNLFDDNIVDNHNNKPRPIITYNFYSNDKSLND